jgi:hypothetical protein
MTADLAAFLLARIEEDEAVARAATPGPWRVDSEDYAEAILADGAIPTYVLSGGRWGGEASVFDATEDALHIARHDPARVLAQCTALRAVVVFCDDQIRQAGVNADAEQIERSFDAGAAFVAHNTLRALASIWAAHEDYDPAWRLG